VTVITPDLRSPVPSPGIQGEFRTMATWNVSLHARNIWIATNRKRKISASADRFDLSENIYISIYCFFDATILSLSTPDALWSIVNSLSVVVPNTISRL
jgi:hypothetical protein